MARMLAITNWFPPQHRGGYEIVCRDVMVRMARRGHHVEVLCGDERLNDRPDGSVPVRRDLRLYWKSGDVWGASLRDARIVEQHNQAVLQKTLSEVSPDLVCVWHMAAMSLNLITSILDAGLAVTYLIHDDWPIYAVDQDAWASRWQGSPLRRLAGSIASSVAGVPTVLPDLGSAGPASFVSEFTRDAVRGSAPWHFRGATVIPAGIDREELGDVSTPRPWSWRLAYLGRFDRRKGTDTLIKAMPLLPPEATLTLYGRGGSSERQRILELAGSIGVGDRVRVASLDSHELGDAYRAADCVVFPSEWPEPFGMVPLEAMQCGAPVVATGVGGSSEFLRDGENSLLFEAGNENALAETVRRLADDTELRSKLRDGGVATAEVYDIDRLADLYERWFVEAAKGRTARIGRVELGGVERATADPLARHHAQTAELLSDRHGRSPGDSEIKLLYRDLGEGWWDKHSGEDRDQGMIPVLSAPETTPTVVRLLADRRGLILDAGCGPNPAVSIGLARSGGKVLIGLDIGVGTVRVAVSQAREAGVDLLGVVGDIEQLPFRSGAFDGLVCDDTIEHLPNDAAGVAELSRVLNASGLAILATPNRHNAVILKARARDWWRGWRRPASDYFVASSHLREYTWTEFGELINNEFVVRARVPIGWQQTRKRRLATRLLRGPAREFSQIIVVEASPR